MVALRDWLRRLPYPTNVQVGERTIKVPSDGKRRWADLVETIEAAAKGGDKLICLDDSGGVIRATIYEGEGDTTAGNATEETRKLAGETEIVQLARLLKEAGDGGADRYRDMFKIAFEAQNNMLATFAARLSSLESAWGTATNEIAKANATIIQLAAERDAAQQGEEPSLGDQMIGGLLGAMNAGAGPDAAAAVAEAAAKNGKSSGKAKVSS